MKKRINIWSSMILLISILGCTELEPEILDGIEITNDGSVPVESQLLTAYQSLRQYQDQTRSHRISEHTGDAMVGPTRGRDWDDNGVWRQLHVHTWTPLNNFIIGSWDEMGAGVFSANQVIANNPSDSQMAQAKLIRAYHSYFYLDMYGILPFKEPGFSGETSFLTREEGTQFVIDELESILPDLPELSDPTVANKDIARFLLAKIYLNRAVFLSDNPAGPYTFDSADMNEVIANVDAMTASLATSYWDNFIPANSETSSEIIFASKNIQDGDGGNVQSHWRMGIHYNQTPDGWNGFTTIAEYYDRFDPDDIRINNPDPDALENSGYNLGYLVGQQYGPGGPDSGSALEDRDGNPLVFTKELSLLTKGETLETAGIRGVKYKPDYGNINKPDNDYILARYSDALLMKAEAIARGGTPTNGDTAESLVNQIRARVSQPPLTGSLEDIYAERGRELWWEGWRRNDMIRFGTYLDTKELKDFQSGEERVLFPVPAGALSNFPQNPGY